MKQAFYIAIFALVMMLHPTRNLAIQHPADDHEMSCCAEDDKEIENKENCCHDQKGHQGEDKDKTDHAESCDGSCKHTSCHCPSGKMPLQVPTLTFDYSDDIPTNNPSYDIRPVNIPQAGFCDTWLLPKIS